MNFNRNVLMALIGTTALAWGLTARAECEQAAGKSDHWQEMKQGMADLGARAEARLTRFKEELKITPQQESLWLTYAAKVRDGVDHGVKAVQVYASEVSLSASERMDRMTAAMKERLAAMESVAASFKDLYASMSPEQKAVADQHLNRIGHGDEASRASRPVPQS